MNQAFLLAILLAFVPAAHGQHRKMPEVNSKLADLPPDNLVAPGKPVSYTEITFTNHYGRYDTSALRIVKCSSDGKMLQTDLYEYNEDKEYTEAPFDRIQSYIGQGERTVFTYDERGRLKTKMEYAVLPANSLNTIWTRMMSEAMEESRKNEREGNLRDDPKRSEKTLNRLTALIANGIPERAILKEETRYDADGNEIYTSQPENRSESRYIYTYDQSGRVTMQRELYNRCPNDKVGGAAIYDTRFTYTHDDRVDSVIMYYMGNDTNQIPTDILPTEYVHYRYHDMGKPYVISYERDGKEYTHIVSYVDTMIEGHTVLSKRTTDMVPKNDTGSVTTYQYDKNGNRTASVSTYFNDGKPSSVIITRTGYNREGLPVEVRIYRGEAGETEHLSEQSLFLYNTADDKETLARSMSYRRPRKSYKEPVARPPSGRSSSPVVEKTAAGNGSKEEPAVEYNGKVSEPQQRVFTMVEQMPAFKGDVNAYISQQLRYPAAALKAGIEGKVVVGFVVTDAGRVTGAEILKPLGGGCDEEALRIVSGMPAWTPGKQNGTAVNVHYTLAINFQRR